MLSFLYMEETKRPIRNVLILAALMIAGFFQPFIGLGGMVLLLFNSAENQLAFTKEEKTMAIIGATVLGIFFILNIIHGIVYPAEMPETSSELLRSLILI